MSDVSFVERKALSQFYRNPMISPAATKSKRSMAVVERLIAAGLIVDEEGDGFSYQLTEAGLAVLGKAIES